MELYVSVTFTCCGNVKIQFYVIISRFRHVSGTEMLIHVSVMFMSADLYCCLFPLRFCKRISAVVCFRYVSANGFPMCLLHLMVLYTLFQKPTKQLVGTFLSIIPFLCGAAVPVLRDKFSLLISIHFYSTNWEKLLKDQTNFPLVIILFILITCPFDFVLML